MRRLLLRAAVITGGCTAGIIIGLSISGDAHADDRPRIGNGLIRDTLTNAMDRILPPPNQPEHDHQSDDRPTPVQDIATEISDGIKDTVVKVIDTITPPPPSTPVDATKPSPGPDPEPTPNAPAGNTHPPAATPNPDKQLVSSPPPPDPNQVPPVTGRATTSTASHPRHDANTTRTPIQLHAIPIPALTPDPPPALPGQPDHNLTPGMGAPVQPVGGTPTDCTITARATRPRTHAPAVADRYQTSPGRTLRPDAPSG